MKRIEAYLISTGKFQLYFAWWFMRKYRTDINLLVGYYHIWQCIEGGLHPYDTYRVFLRSHSWTFEHYQKITSVCAYIGFIKLVGDTTNLQLSSPIASCAVDGYEGKQGRKEAPVA